MEEGDLHIAMRNELKGFYGVLKSSDEHLRFVFLTGVTKFSHVSVFSDLNHLVDLTLDPNYADICGITQKEVEENFDPEIAEILENTGKSREVYLGELMELGFAPASPFSFPAQWIVSLPGMKSCLISEAVILGKFMPTAVMPICKLQQRN